MVKQLCRYFNLALTAPWVFGLALVTSSWGQDIEVQPLSIGALQEIGMVYDGQFDEGARPFRRAYVDHLGAFLSQNFSEGEHLTGMVGFGGIFQFPLPERPEGASGPPAATWPSLRTKFFFIAPSGHLQYQWGSSETPAFTLKGGMFPYKYNPEAHNLGEYLFRAEAYPTILTSGGLLMANSSAAWLKGLVGTYRQGGFSLDLLALTETTIPPLYQISLGAVAQYSLGGGLFDLGMGVNFKRLIPVINDPSKTNEESSNAYISINGRFEPGDKEFYGQPKDFYADRADLGQADSAAMASLESTYARKEAIVALANSVIFKWESLQEDRQEQIASGGSTAAIDSQITAFYAEELAATEAAKAGQVGPALDSLNDVSDIYQNVRGYAGYYSASATLVMARATLNLGKLLDADWVGPQGLKFFAEAALLGVDDYPVYYTDKKQRLPLMAGLTLPTGSFLDLLSLQVEYFDNPYINSWANKAQGANVPGFAGGKTAYYSGNEYNDVASKDSFKWSVLAQKKISVFQFGFQIARDHLRLVHDKFFFGPGLESGVVTASEKSWYWAFQLGVGI